MGEHTGIIGGVELEALVQAAKGGDACAACRLGDYYREGEGFPKNPRKAFRWYARSALAGDPVAQNQLGCCLEHGIGCRPNAQRAAKFYGLAASQGLATAQKNLGLCYLVGRGLDKDLEMAREWLEKAAAQDEPGAVDKLVELDHPEPTSANAPQRGGRWGETFWFQERSGEWDCAGGDVIRADEARRRIKKWTAKYGPPRVTIGCREYDDTVQLKWSTGVGSEITLSQYGCEREHSARPDA